MKKVFIKIMLVLGFSLNVFAASNTPESVITSFLEAMRNGDETKARTYLDLNSFIKPKNIMKPNLGTKDFTKRDLGLVDNMFNQGGKGNNWNYKITKDKHKLKNPDDKGIYTYVVSCSTAKYELENFYFVKKINNTWKITGWI